MSVFFIFIYNSKNRDLKFIIIEVIFWDVKDFVIKIMVFIVIRVYLVFMWNVFIGFVFYMILVVFFDEKFLKKLIK